MIFFGEEPKHLSKSNSENSFSWNIKEEEGIKFHAGKENRLSFREVFRKSITFTSYVIYPLHFCFFEDQDF